MSKAYLSLLIVYVVWGTTFGAMHIGLADLPPFVFACQRFLIAGLLMVLICLARGEALPPAGEIRRNLIAGFFLFVVGNGVTFWTLQYLSVGFAGLLVAMHPFWMLTLAAVMPPKEPIRPMALLGLLTGFVGLSILLAPQLATPHAAHGMLVPCLLITLMTGFAWAMGSIYTRKNPVRATLLMSVGLQNFTAGLILIPVSMIFGENPFMIAAPHGLAALAYLIFIGSMVGMTCYIYAVEKLPVAVSSTFAYVTPLMTVMVGCVLLGEQVTPSLMMGAAVILSGVALVQKSSQPQPVMQTVKSPSNP